MPHYSKNYITQVVLRADFVPGTVPMTQPLGEDILPALADFPVRNTMNRSKTEVKIQKTPQGPVKNTSTRNFLEHNFVSEDKSRRIALCTDYVFLEERRFDGYSTLRELFTDVVDALASQYPGLKLHRLGMRYVNEIKLPEPDAGPGLGADFWEHYINPLLLGGLRFAANDGALARHMCSTELNYGIDRATVRYGIFNHEYPKPNRFRNFILDIDTYCQTQLAPASTPAKLDDFHAAACSVFEAAITNALRARMGQE